MTIENRDNKAEVADSKPGEAPTEAITEALAEAFTEVITDNTASAAGEAAAKEIGGREGPDPTRFGDWEKNGRCIDF